MHNKCTNFVISRCAHACILSSFGLYALLPSHCSSLEHHPHHHGVPRSTTSSPPALQPVCHKTRSTSAVVQAGHHTDPQRIVSVPSPLVLFSHHVIVMVSAIFSIIMITPVLPFALPTTIQPRFTHPFYQPRSPMLVSLTTCLVTTNHLAHPPADQCHLLITQSLTNPFSCHIRVTPVRQSSEHFQLCSTTRRLAQTLTLYITNT